ncbi:MAG: Uma2 family endonuclease [Limnospira sp.]
MVLSTVKWSLDDYHQMIKTGLLVDRPVELLAGEIVKMPPEGEPHAFFSSEAGAYLTRILGDRALVRQAKPITLPNNSETEPDIAIVAPLGYRHQCFNQY